eukprot:gene1028-617_t
MSKLVLSLFGGVISVQMNNNNDAGIPISMMRHAFRRNNFSQRDIRGLVGAADRGNLLFVQELIYMGMNINAKTQRGDAALSMAATKGRVDVVEFLLSRPGVDVNIRRRNGKPPIKLAAKFGHYQVVKMLLEHPDTDVNAVDRNNKNALMMCCKHEAHIGSRIVHLLYARPAADLSPAWATRKGKSKTAGRRVVAKSASSALLNCQWPPSEISSGELTKSCAASEIDLTPRAANYRFWNFDIIETGIANYVRSRAPHPIPANPNGYSVFDVSRAFGREHILYDVKYLTGSDDNPSAYVSFTNQLYHPQWQSMFCFRLVCKGFKHVYDGGSGHRQIESVHKGNRSKLSAVSKYVWKHVFEYLIPDTIDMTTFHVATNIVRAAVRRLILIKIRATQENSHSSVFSSAKNSLMRLVGMMHLDEIGSEIQGLIKLTHDALKFVKETYVLTQDDNILRCKQKEIEVVRLKLVRTIDNFKAEIDGTTPTNSFLSNQNN